MVKIELTEDIKKLLETNNIKFEEEKEEVIKPPKEENEIKQPESNELDNMKKELSEIKSLLLGTKETLNEHVSPTKKVVFESSYIKQMKERSKNE